MTATWTAAMGNLVEAMMDRYHWRVTGETVMTCSRTNLIPK